MYERCCVDSTATQGKRGGGGGGEADAAFSDAGLGDGLLEEGAVSDLVEIFGCDLCVCVGVCV